MATLIYECRRIWPARHVIGVNNNAGASSRYLKPLLDAASVMHRPIFNFTARQKLNSESAPIALAKPLIIHCNEIVHSTSTENAYRPYAGYGKVGACIKYSGHADARTQALDDDINANSALTKSRPSRIMTSTNNHVAFRAISHERRHRNKPKER